MTSSLFLPQKDHSAYVSVYFYTLPETTLTVNPNPADTGKTVTLTCSVGSDSGWSYTWYKDNTKKVVTLSDRHTTTGATFTISRAAESDQGLYWCQGEIQSRSISSIISVTPGPSTSVLVGVVVALVVAGVLLAILLVLLCRYKNAKGGANIYDTITPSDSNDSATGLVHVTYAEVDLKQKAKAKKKKDRQTPSSPVIVTASEKQKQRKSLVCGDRMEHTLLCLLLLLSTHIYSGHSEDDDGQAKAVLTTHPKSSQIFRGESVTFRCNIQRGEVTDWKYTWRKDDVDSISSKHEYEMSEVKISDNGVYRCLGTHIDNRMYSKWSDAVRLTVTALPTASVKMVTTQEILYSGDTVKLWCDISNHRDWTYRWLINKERLSSQTSKNTTISLSDQAGQYQCQGTRTRQPQNSYLSSSLHISVTALPETSLTMNPNPAYKGETVTLTCSVGSDSGWIYTWYKDNTKKVVTLSDRHTTTGATFTISRAAESDQGLYWCQGEIQSRSISSIISDPVTITVKERPVAVLTLQPSWPQTFSGETVALRYDRGEKRLSIFFITLDFGVMYNTLLTKWVNILKTEHLICVTSFITDRPQAVLSVYPQWLNPGDSVTLSCGVKESSTGWRFFWYRTVPYTAGLLSLLDRSYSVEPLSGSGTTEDSYTLISAGPSHTGGYVCRAGRGDPVYDTLYSEPQFLWSGDPQPSLSLKTRPNRTQHFTSKSLSLSCEEKRNSTGWRLKRYREKAVESECVSTWGSGAGSTCTIRFTRKKDSGVYWCESGSGEYSNAVNITVDVGSLILESPPYPITEGDSVTLSCANRYQETNPIPKVDFYKDGVLISNETTGEMTIPVVSKSDEGFYKCKSNEGESPESWVTVRGSVVSISLLPRLLCSLLVVSPFLLVSIVLMVKCCRARGVTPGPSTSVLVGVVVGLVVAGVLLAILLVLLCRYKKAQGPTSPRGPTWTPNRTKDLPRARLLMLEMTADPKENPVYSEVKTGKTTGKTHCTEATGPVDVTYAEVDLKQKAKAKKKEIINPT
ncbi:uncharacterized protein [Salmo salar]|uniref:Ig-like domain-containing protein n=1 Tax=Salmo salar TaxID=8030 RepID=A0ABM3F5F2_SALSA|nr:uncharacterized protein LOC123723867 [Salmo salar]